MRHLQVAESRNSIAIVLEAQGRMDEAIVFYNLARTAIKMQGGAVGETSLTYSTILGNLAGIYQARAQWVIVA